MEPIVSAYCCQSRLKRKPQPRDPREMTRISVYGIKDRLGIVLAIWLASIGFNVAVCEENRFSMRKEPNLAGMYRRYKRNLEQSSRRDFASSPVILLALDTPIDKDGKGDYGVIRKEALRLRNQMRRGSVLLVSSQVNVGFCEGLVNSRVGTAYWPENIRRGRAVESLAKTRFYPVGVDGRRTRAKLLSLFSRIPAEIEFCDLRTAEASKVLMNGFLATCVSYANEMDAISRRWGASSRLVHKRLVKDYRVGDSLPLAPGRPYLGPLERDVDQLRGGSVLFKAVRAVNESAK